MNAPFHKFQTTPHLEWLGTKPVRGDKVLTPAERVDFLRHTITVEEKIDGANLGLSISEDGQLQFQNRGNWLNAPFRGQWEPLRGWASNHEMELRERLRPGLILFGEWCYARHSVSYAKLPDWFLGFDVFDIQAGRFWSVDRRNELISQCGFALVHPIAETPSVVTFESLRQLLSDSSAFGSERLEGLYLRMDEGLFWLCQRAKLVNPGFVQSISRHWSKSGITKNRLDYAQTS